MREGKKTVAYPGGVTGGNAPPFGDFLLDFSSESINSLEFPTGDYKPAIQ